jgi:outer membrane assembly lipoprotein YfgL
MSRVLALLLVLPFLGTGCAWVSALLGETDHAEPPAALVSMTNSVPITTLWSTKLGAGFDEQFVKLVPAVAEGRVFSAERKGRVRAFDAASGKLLWETDIEAPLSGGPGFGTGRVLVGTSDAEVVALRADDGALLWRAPVSSEVLSVPQAADGIVVVRTVDGKVFGLRAEDGTQLWVYERHVPVLTLRGISSPMLRHGRVIGGFDNGKLAALELKDGRPLWEVSVAVPQGRSELERMVDIDGDPVVVDDDIYVATFQGGVAAVDAESGQVLWSRELSSFAGIGVDDAYLYITDDESHVWALDRQTGTALWKQDKLHQRALTAPVPYGDYVVVGDFEGYLHWLSKADGHFVARTRVDDEGLIAPPVFTKDVLYVYGAGGVLAALSTPRFESGQRETVPVASYVPDIGFAPSGTHAGLLRPTDPRLAGLLGADVYGGARAGDHKSAGSKEDYQALDDSGTHRGERLEGLKDKESLSAEEDLNEAAQLPDSSQVRGEDRGGEEGRTLPGEASEPAAGERAAAGTARDDGGRLKVLESLRQKNLVTEQEYQQKHQEIVGSSSPENQNISKHAGQRLAILERLRQQDLITQEEYLQKRAEILGRR